MIKINLYRNGGADFIFMAKFRNILAFFVCLFAFVIFSGSASAATTTAPIIVKTSNSYIEKGKNIEGFLVSGLNRVGTEVLVYLDGVFKGTAKVNSKQTLTDNFYFKYNQTLSAGNHKVMVIARDKTSLALSSAKESVFFVPISKGSAKEPIFSAPTLLGPNEKTVTSDVRVKITGVAASDSKVLIFIDGKLNGKFVTGKSKTGAMGFAYKPFLNLSRGYHTAYAQLEDVYGNKTKQSNLLKFHIELPFPAPTLLKPIVNKNTTSARPYIVGLTKNNSTVKIFIDKKLNAKIAIKNHPSGTANFAYKPEKPLTNGNHLVYTTAIDSRGKESKWSNQVWHKVSTSKVTSTKIVKKSVEVRKEALKTEELKKEEEKVDEVKKEEEVDLSDNQDAKEEQSATGTGLLDESKKSQNKVSINLIIFIAFLVGVIAWIFWVNKELIKEKNAEEEIKEE